MWYAIYDPVDGRLVTQTDEEPPQARLDAAGLEVLILAEQPPDSQMWDEATRAFVGRPTRPHPDRIIDIVTDDRLAWMSRAQKEVLMDVLGDVLPAGDRF